MFKMLLVGYLYGIKSERRLVQEVQLNIAYRWFCGFELSDRIPDRSTFSKTRQRKWAVRQPENICDVTRYKVMPAKPVNDSRIISSKPAFGAEAFGAAAIRLSTGGMSVSEATPIGI